MVKDESGFDAEEFLKKVEEDRQAFERLQAESGNSDGQLRELLASIEASEAESKRLLENAAWSPDELRRLIAQSAPDEGELPEWDGGPELEALLRSLDDDVAEITDAFDPSVFASLSDADVEVVPPPDPNATASDVASWMQHEVETSGDLYQERAAYQIRRKFGNKFLYTNRNGNAAISREVLREFLVRTHRTVVWEQRERYWRLRKPYDSPNARRV